MALKPRNGGFIKSKLQDPSSREIPNSKSQTPINFQIPNTQKQQRWDYLMIQIWCFFGVWSLGFGASWARVPIGLLVCERDEHILQRRRNGANVGLRDASFGQVGADEIVGSIFIDQQMHRLTKDCGRTNKRQLSQCLQANSDMIAGHVNAPRIGRIHYRQLFELIRLPANDQLYPYNAW